MFRNMENLEYSALQNQNQNGRMSNLLKNKNLKYNDYCMTGECHTPNNFSCIALRGNIQSNPVSRIFFSNTNINAIQLGIKNTVLNKSCGKIDISNQSIDELLVIMRSIYLEKARNLLVDPVSQVKFLNGYVIEYAVPRIINEVNMHNKYIEDITKLPMPMKYGENTSVTGTKTLEMLPF